MQPLFYLSIPTHKSFESIRKNGKIFVPLQYKEIKKEIKKEIYMQDMILREYVAPQVEIIEVEVEKGFAGSGNDEGNGGGMTLPGWEII